MYFATSIMEKNRNKISQNIVIWIYEDAYLSTFLSILWYENEYYFNKRLSIHNYKYSDI